MALRRLTENFYQMPESRKRKPKRRKPAQPQPQNQRTSLVEHRKTFWEKIRDHPVIWTIGVLAALIGIGEPIHQAILAPEISVDSNADVSAPFSVPFNVRNKSWLFSMTSAQLHCGIDQVVMNAFTVQSLTLASRLTTILASSDGAFRCMIGTGADNLLRVSPANLTSAHILLSMKYNTLGIPRKSAETEFTWYTGANPPRWIRGRIVN
jgi:hypothetical protein